MLEFVLAGYDGRDMSPSVSRSLVALTCVLAALPAAAEDAWKAILAGNQVYYAKRADFDKLQQERSEGKVEFAFADLSVDVVKDSKRTRVPSGAVLACPAKTRSDCRVIVDARAGGTYDLPVHDLDAPASQPPVIQDAVQRVPEGVAPSIWNIVVSNKNIARSWWKPAAVALQQLSKSNPDAFKKLTEHGRFTYDKVLVALAAAIAGGDTSTADLARRAGQEAERAAAKAPPSNVVPVSNSAAMAPATGVVPHPSVAPAGQPDKDEANAPDPINALTKLLERDDVRDSIKKRLVEFIEKPKDGETFVSPDIPAEHKDDAMKALAAGVGTWVDEQKGKNPGALALLYFVAGDVSKPAWLGALPKDAAKNLARDLAADWQLRKHFVGALVDAWKEKKAGPYKGDFAGGAQHEGQPQSSGGPWIVDFLNTSSSIAEKTWKDKKIRNLDIPTGDASHSDSTVSGGPGHRTMGGKIFTDWTADQMYGRRSNTIGMCPECGGGAIGYKHKIPGTEITRDLSFRICSKTNTFGSMTEALCVVDQTHRNDMVGQYFDLSKDSELTLHLDDRPNKTTPKYKLTIKNGMVTMQPIDAADGKPSGDAFSASIAQLKDVRRQYAERAGLPTTINGQKFRVIPQGGFVGSVLYFPVDDKGKVSSDEPALEAVISRAAGTMTERANSTEGLGYVGTGKDKKGYDLVWDDKAKAYMLTEVKQPTKPEEIPWNFKKEEAKESKHDSSGTQSSSSDTSKGNSSGGTSGSGTESHDLKACTIGDKLPLQAIIEPYSDEGGWKRYTEGVGEKSNNTYLCLYGNTAIFMANVAPSGAISEEDGMLVVKSILLDTKSDKTHLTPTELKDLAVKDGPNGRPVAAMSGGDLPIKSGWTYYIPTAGLESKIREKSKGLVFALLDYRQAIWAEVQQPLPNLPTNPVFNVYLHKSDESQGDAFFLNQVESAVKRFGVVVRDGKAHSSLCAEADGTINPAVDEEIKKLLALPSFKTALESSGSKPGSKDDPVINFSCLDGGDGTVVQASFAGSGDVLTLDKLRKK